MKEAERIGLLTRQRRMSYPKYTPHHIHNLLCQKLLSERYRSESEQDVNKQAEFCPYYTPVSGKLGLDWGVIVNPLSPRFGQLVFEHDFCECPNHDFVGADSDGTGWIATDEDS